MRLVPMKNWYLDVEGITLEVINEMPHWEREEFIEEIQEMDYGEFKRLVRMVEDLEVLLWMLQLRVKEKPPRSFESLDLMSVEMGVYEALLRLLSEHVPKWADSP